MGRLTASRATSGSLAAFSCVLIVQFSWAVFASVSARSESTLLVDALTDSLVVLAALVSVAGVAASLWLALVLARRSDNAATGDILLFLTSSALGVATQLLPAASFRLGAGFQPLWWGIPVAEQITTATFLIAGVAYVRFTARFPVNLLKTVELGRLGRLTAVHSLTGQAWIWLALVPILMLDSTEGLSDGPLAFGWSFLVWFGAIFVLMCGGVYNLWLAIRVGSQEGAKRAQIVLASLLVFGLSLAAAVAIFFLGDPPGAADATLGIGYFIHIILLIFAVFLFGALDPALALRRSAWERPSRC